MKYVVVYEQTPNNWSAYVPDLPGCIATGKTREETEEMIREAVALPVESLLTYHEPVPEPGAWTGTVEVPDSVLAGAPATVRETA